MTTLFQRLTRLLPPPAIILILGVLLLSACGGGGGGGGATANSQNSGDLGTAAKEGIKQAIADNNTPTTTLSRGNANQATHIELAKYLVAQTLTQRSAKSPTQTTARNRTATVSGNCGGNATITGTAQSGTVQFNHYCEDSVTARGTATYSIFTSSFTFTYSNFTLSYSGESYYVRNLIINCRTESDGSESCTYSSDFTGNNGITYTNSNARVAGNNSSGYNVTVTVSDPEFGTITVAATNITICSNGNIGTGVIRITDSTGNTVITVHFPSCNTFSVTYNGVIETYSQ